MNLPWGDFKQMVTSRAVGIEYVELYNLYSMAAAGHECIIKKYQEPTGDQLDFEANFKAKANKPAATESLFVSKKFGTKGLYKRFEGVEKALVAGANTIDFPIAYPWVKIMGVEIIGAESGDKAELFILDSSAGTYSGVPDKILNQFCKSLNIAKDYYFRDARLDGDLYAGMVIHIIYSSKSEKPVYINFDLTELK